jgi:hypothetical protein
MVQGRDSKLSATNKSNKPKLINYGGEKRMKSNLTFDTALNTYNKLKPLIATYDYHDGDVIVKWMPKITTKEYRRINYSEFCKNYGIACQSQA